MLDNAPMVTQFRVVTNSAPELVPAGADDAAMEANRED
jgi:hypothetical protein